MTEKTTSAPASSTLLSVTDWDNPCVFVLYVFQCNFKQVVLYATK